MAWKAGEVFTDNEPAKQPADQAPTLIPELHVLWFILWEKTAWINRRMLLGSSTSGFKKHSKHLLISKSFSKPHKSVFKYLKGTNWFNLKFIWRKFQSEGAAYLKALLPKLDLAEGTLRL